MKRDMGLIREIMLHIEAEPYVDRYVEVTIDGRTAEKVGYHVKLMYQAGLVEADNTEGVDRADASGWKPVCLTREGHEFLDSSREPGAWEKTKPLRDKAGGLAFDVLKTALIEVSKRAALAALAG
jgi:hypothetical protein